MRNKTCFLLPLLYVVVLYADTVVTITDIESWEHPVKKILHKKPYTISRLELTKNKTYPCFYVKSPGWPMLDNRLKIIKLANAIASANAWWDYTLVNKEDSLYFKVICDRKKGRISEILVNGETYFAEDSLPFNSRAGKKWYLSSSLKKLIGQGNYSVSYDNICGYLENDYDVDGKKEIVLAVLDTYDKGCRLPEYSRLLIFKVNSGSVDLMGEYTSGAEIYCSLSEIRLENEKRTFIYTRTTNGFCSVLGYKVLSVVNGHVGIVDGAFSATGEGSDYLVDSDNNGRFDSHLQKRTVYGVSLETKYEYSDHKFVLKNTTVDTDGIEELNGDAERVVKLAVALKYFMSDGANNIYKVANKRVIEASFKQICSTDDFPEISALNMLDWEEMSCNVIKQDSTVTNATLKSTACGIDAHVELEMVGDGWVVSEYKNLPGRSISPEF